MAFLILDKKEFYLLSSLKNLEVYTPQRGWMSETQMSQTQQHTLWSQYSESRDTDYHKFKASLVYLESCRPAQATWQEFFKNKQQKTPHKQEVPKVGVAG